MRLKVDYNDNSEIIGIYETDSMFYHNSPYEFVKGDLVHVLSVIYSDRTETLGLYKQKDEAENAKLNCIAVGLLPDNDKASASFNVYPFHETPIANDHIDWSQPVMFKTHEIEL